MTGRKQFDCVRMKREGGRLVYEQIKDMSIEEELAFWKARGKALDKRIKAAKARRKIVHPHAA